MLNADVTFVGTGQIFIRVVDKTSKCSTLSIATQIGRSLVDEVYNPFFLNDIPNDNLLAQPESPNDRQATTDVFISDAGPDETTPTGGAQYPSVYDRIPGSTMELTRTPPLKYESLREQHSERSRDRRWDI